MFDTTQPDALIAATFRQVLDEAGPRQAAVLQYCAIPHWFDAEVLAVLRERADGNDRVIELLRGYSFVRPVGAGRYAYQDDVRAALLAEWRAERASELGLINRRLAAHFAARVAAEQSHEVQLPAVTITMRPHAEWDVWRREALYHLLQADPAAGLAQLRDTFEQAEASYRLGEAEALLQVVADVPLDQAGERWVRYMRARLARSSLHLDDAIGRLEALLAEPGLEQQLAAEARQTLGDALAEAGQWARATELYRASLAMYQATGNRRRAAEVMLRLGEAYRGLARNTGGWYVPAFAQQPALRALGQAWYWLLALPFVLVAALLRRTPWALPRAQLLSAYQNWLLTRIYRTAQGWYARARAIFAALGDELGLLQVDQQQAEIVLLYGYAGDALAQFEQLRQRPAAQPEYRRLWIDADIALARIECGDPAGARALLDATLEGFRSIGDLRGEAAVLALQGRAAEAGASAAAFAAYQFSLDRFRALRYAAAREQALYALRAWQRRVGPGPISEQINTLLAREPEKRYVARFPRSLLPLLQGLVLGVVPLAMLLATIVSPSQVLRRIGDSQIIEQQTVFNLWNVLVLLVVLGLLALGVYALVGLALIFFIRLEALEREQPDYLITDAQGIARYDYRGTLALRMEWDEVRRWIRVDRRLWQRPMALFSLAFLEAADGSDMRIDGITGWYNGLQRDIAMHLRDAGNPASAEQRGVAIGPSKSGALLLLGVLLLLLYISSENRWSDGLILALSPSVYTLVFMVTFSGLPILIPLSYWFVTQPLAIDRLLGLRERWPWIVGTAGLGALLLYVLSGGAALSVPALNIGLLLSGAYALAEAAYTLLFPRRPGRGAALIALALLAAAALALPQASRLFYSALSNTYVRQADYAGAVSAGPVGLHPDAPAPSAAPGQGADTALAWQHIGNARYLNGDFAGAVVAYTQALSLLTLDTAAAREQAAVILFNRAWAQRKLADRQPGAQPQSQRDFVLACELAPQLCQK